MAYEVGCSQQPLVTATPAGTFSTPLNRNANYSASGLGTNVSAADRAAAEAAQFAKSRANTQMIQTPIQQGKSARVNAKRQGTPANKRNTTVINNAAYKSMEPGSVNAIVTDPPSGVTYEDEALTAGPGEEEENIKRQANLDRQRWQNQARSKVEQEVGDTTSIEAQQMRDKIRSGGYTPGDRNRIDSENNQTIFYHNFNAEQERRKER